MSARQNVKHVHHSRMKEGYGVGKDDDILTPAPLTYFPLVVSLLSSIFLCSTHPSLHFLVNTSVSVDG